MVHTMVLDFIWVLYAHEGSLWSFIIGDNQDKGIFAVLKLCLL